MRTVLSALLASFLALLVPALLVPAPAAAARPAAAAPAPSVPAPAGLTSTDVSFKGHGGVTLHGTVLAKPKEAVARPGVVLVTGSGSGVPREHLLTEAVAFARQGLAVLIYDKRTEGYSGFRRSYDELAVDAAAAVEALRARPGVDRSKVGIWGLSEGGWVAPLAASRSDATAFVIVVGGNAMSPLRQQTWNEMSGLRRAGASGSLVDRGKRNFNRFGADTGLFAEAYFDAQGVLERVDQPLLGIWGVHDLQTPPGDNPPLFAEALRRGGNTHYTFRYFADANHGAHQTPDKGITHGEALAPGYAELVGSWVRDVTGGRLPNADAPAPPKQDHPSPDVPRSAWWESAWTQTVVFAFFLLAFATYPVWALVRRVRGRRAPPVSRWARLVAGAGAGAVLGVFVYLFYLMSAGRWPDPGPLLGGEPLVWLALRVLAVAAIAATVATALAWRRAGRSVPRGERVRVGLLLTAGTVFLPWALYWGLLVP
ncbi:alpha/beta hydrolase family protein [Actinomadura sp. 9N407]|uniref:alpha/beta hydrolase family protein n=1 Tax=Actinomadura sp. 9N407 TaxID=3375154 RepID=UPI0037A5681C